MKRIASIVGVAGYRGVVTRGEEHARLGTWGRSPPRVTAPIVSSTETRLGLVRAATQPRRRGVPGPANSRGRTAGVWGLRALRSRFAFP